jgi:hypothetical protein
MHKTQHNLVKGHIDLLYTTTSLLECEGWSFLTTGDVSTVRVKNGDNFITPTIVERYDVASFFNSNNVVTSGWKFSIVPETSVFIQYYVNNEWHTIFDVSTKDVLEINDNSSKTFIVVDNFYKNPDDIRNFALSCQFNEHPSYHKGKRTDEVYRCNGLKQKFEELLGKKIKNWEHYGTNGCFQYCIAGEQLVYHSDLQQYAGLLFLTPDAPPECGTSFYRSKGTKKMKVDNYENTFPTGHYDSTKFEMVDPVGNVYNRLVLFDAQLIHSASCYFGNNKENGRLFQLFFFDLE